MASPRLALPGAFLLLCLASTAAFAQGVGINATGAAADTSALLDLSSTAKGLLPPRMTSVQRGAIVLPATGLVVYQTDSVSGLYWNAGTPAAPSWKQVADASAGGGGQWSTLGPNLYYSGGNVGVGTSAFAARFTVVDSINGLRVQTNNAGGVLASFGGFGSIRVDAPGVAGGRFSLLENGNLGIGTNAPNAPLGFPPSLGKKITLYPGATGDVGIGVAGNRLQLYADNPNADVALGYDQAGVFNERFAVKPTGALAVNGNTGSAGQVLQSNGGAAAATWVSPTSVTYNNVHSVTSTGVLATSGGVDLAVPGMYMSFTTPGAARAIVSMSLPIQSAACPGCGLSTSSIRIHVDSFTTIMHTVTMAGGAQTTLTATEDVQLPAGSHIAWVGADTIPGSVGLAISYGSITPSHGELILQVIPQ